MELRLQHGIELGRERGYQREKVELTVQQVDWLRERLRLMPAAGLANVCTSPSVWGATVLV